MEERLQIPAEGIEIGDGPVRHAKHKDEVAEAVIGGRHDACPSINYFEASFDKFVAKPGVVAAVFNHAREVRLKFAPMIPNLFGEKGATWPKHARGVCRTQARMTIEDEVERCVSERKVLVVAMDDWDLENT